MHARLAIAVTLAFACGCSRQTPPAQTAGRNSWTIPHVLRMAELTQPDNLNPYLSQMDVSYDVTSLVYSYLIVADARGRLIGDLATEVPSVSNGGISRDGLIYTYHLRRNVRWQDGVRFTAADVVASWRAVVAPQNLTIYRQGYDKIDAIATPDPYTIVVHLRQRYPPFLTQFFAPLQEGGKPILPAHILARTDFNHGLLSQRAVGTGPFRLVEFRRGDEMVFQRNDGYFRGRPKLKRIELRFAADVATILTLTRTHAVDLIVTPAVELLEQYRAIQGYTTRAVPWNQQGMIVVNGGKPGLGDPLVRRAISLAIDRKEIIATIAHGAFGLPHDAVAPTAIGYVRRPAPPYDPVLANAILERDGWKRGRDGVRSKDGVRLDYTIATTAGSGTYVEIPLLVQAELRAVGIRLLVKAYSNNQIFDFSGPLDTYRFDLAIFGSALSWDPDSHAYFGCDQWFPKGQNFYRYCNRHYDALEAAGLSSDDPRVRAPIYARADAILWNTHAYLPLFARSRILVYNSDLRNYEPNATSTPWWNAWQWDI
jgi:peptide/nickel transport system substrate-binding protein